MITSPDAPRAVARPRATVLGAFVEGWRRTLHAPGVTVAVWIVMTLVSLPPAALLPEDFTTTLRAGTTSERTLQGWDADWTGVSGVGPQRIFTSFT
jgi:hypothetical protein